MNQQRGVEKLLTVGCHTNGTFTEQEIKQGCNRTSSTVFSSTERCFSQLFSHDYCLVHPDTLSLGAQPQHGGLSIPAAGHCPHSDPGILPSAQLHPTHIHPALTAPPGFNQICGRKQLALIRLRLITLQDHTVQTQGTRSKLLAPRERC